MTSSTSLCTTARVAIHDGVPRLVINGRVHPAHAFFQYRPIARHISQMAQAGLQVFSWGSPVGWQGPGCFVHDQVDADASTVLAANPQAWLLPRLTDVAPRWWMDANPDECTSTWTEKGAERVTDWTRIPSPASDMWRRQAEEALRYRIRHIMASPYRDRVVGIHVCGPFEEWMCGFGRPLDFSAPTTRGFRAWLSRHYGGDVSRLRATWGDGQVTFETATVPTPAQRLHADRGLVRDPLAGRQVPDFGRFLSEVTADAALGLCRVARQETQGQLLVGLFYGYLINSIVDANGTYDWAHNAVRQILDSDQVDFLCSPNHYTWSGPGGFDGPQMPSDSVMVRGKLWMTELDQNTFLGRASRTAASHAVKPVTNPTPSHDETLWRMTRDFSNCFVARKSLWWMEQDREFSRYDHPDILAHLSSLCSLVPERDAAPVESTCEVAVLIDEDSRLFLPRANLQLFSLVYTQIQFHLSRLGAPFEVYLHDDLELAGMREHKLYIFLDTLYLDAADRAAITRRVRRDGKTALWLYAPGLLSPEGVADAGMCELTGIKLAAAYDRKTDGGSRLQMHLSNFDHPCCRGVSPSMVFGTETPFCPYVYVDDPEATILGEYILSSRRSGPAGFAVREFEHWRSIFCGAPSLPAPLLRAIAGYAGCHVYSHDDDLVYANSRYLAVQATRGGRKTLCLPKRHRVEDALTGATLTLGEATFADDFRPSETKLYRLLAP